MRQIKYFLGIKTFLFFIFYKLTNFHSFKNNSNFEKKVVGSLNCISFFIFIYLLLLMHNIDIMLMLFYFT